MSVKLFKTKFSVAGMEVLALGFVPEVCYQQKPSSIGLFTHGYTSHKGSLLTWASRLSEEGMPVMIFDLPGHYLGGFGEVENFQDFEEHTHHLFQEAYEALVKELKIDDVDTVILGGHSLGALMALKALNTEFFQDKKTKTICVGFGLLEKGKTHLFETPFYKSTLNLRSQLVSPAIAPEIIFPWIRKQKENLIVKNKTIHLITGDDDLVVGAGGSERILELLNSQGNQTTLDKPSKLPHHLPEQAASFIKKYLKKENILPL